MTAPNLYNEPLHSHYYARDARAGHGGVASYISWTFQMETNIRWQFEKLVKQLNEQLSL